MAIIVKVVGLVGDLYNGADQIVRGVAEVLLKALG